MSNKLRNKEQRLWAQHIVKVAIAHYKQGTAPDDLADWLCALNARLVESEALPEAKIRELVIETMGTMREDPSRLTRKRPDRRAQLRVEREILTTIPFWVERNYPQSFAIELALRLNTEAGSPFEYDCVRDFVIDYLALYVEMTTGSDASKQPAERLN